MGADKEATQQCEIQLGLLRKALEMEIDRLGSLPVLSAMMEDDLSAAQHKELTQREAKGIQNEGRVILNIFRLEKSLEGAEMEVVKAKISLIKAYKSAVEQFRAFFSEKEDFHTRLIDGETALISVPPIQSKIEETVEESKIPEGVRSVSEEVEKKPGIAPSAEWKIPEFPSLAVSRPVVPLPGKNHPHEASPLIPASPILTDTKKGSASNRTATPADREQKPRSGNRSKPSSSGSFITSPTEEEKPSRIGALPTFLLKKRLLGNFSNDIEEDETRTMTTAKLKDKGEAIPSLPESAHKKTNFGSFLESSGHEIPIVPEVVHCAEETGTGANFCSMELPQLPQLQVTRINDNSKDRKGESKENRKGGKTKESYGLSKGLREYQETLASNKDSHEETFSLGNDKPSAKRQGDGTKLRELTLDEYSALTKHVRDKLSFEELNHAIAQLRRSIAEFSGALTRKSLQKMMEKELSSVKVVVFCSALTESGRLLRQRPTQT